MSAPKNCRLQGYTFHARLTIPTDVRHLFGDKHEFSRSLETGDKKLATVRAAETVAMWKRDIHSARNGGNVSEWTRNWIGYLKGAETTSANDDGIPSNRDAALFVLEDELEEKIEGGHLSRDEAVRAFKVISGERIVLREHTESYLKQFRNLNVKTQGQYASAIKRFVEKFQDSSDVTPKRVRSWLAEMADEDGFAAKTITRIINQAKTFWKYLRERELVSENPFEDIDAPVPKSAKQTLSYEPFTPLEAVQLLAAAKASGDDHLHLLIMLGMYTAARIEELAMLKTADVCIDAGHMVIRGTKTAAANREVPIHPSLLPILTSITQSQLEYVIDGLTIDRRGERGKAIGKRFGRLKVAMGFTSRTKVFHSIRKTVTTLFEQAGVPEGVAADIVGHEKKTMTYGLYSGGSSMEQKRDAIMRLTYPALLNAIAA